MNVKDRFLSYVAYPTMSDEESSTVPSTQKQRVLGEMIVRDMLEIGIKDAHIDGNGYVYGTIEANTDAIADKIGFIAHMDTSSEASDENIKTRELLYEGGDIVLNKEKNIITERSVYPSLDNYVGKHLIVTDGTTLLGADDKAGIAEIMTAAENILRSDKPHGVVKIAFTPDEEIGRGADCFDVEKFGADYAYTVDGGSLGELEYENFNAAAVKVKFHGISIHPGSAKNIMKNAAIMACEFDRALPEHEIPGETEGYEGFHHLIDMKGDVEYAELTYIIRDHNREKFENKKVLFSELAEKTKEKYGDTSIEISITDSYYNMRELVEQRIEIVEYIKTAMLQAGVEPNVIPIRGGTDGARLSYMGLLCPNICTGGENFHSRFEYIPVESMEKTVEIIQNIVYNAK